MKQRKKLMGGGVLLTAGLLLSTVYGISANKVSQPVQEGTSDVLEAYDVYGIGSVSKMFGTVAVMQLVQEGKVDLDAPLIDYIPEFEMADERYKDITPRMLLNHTSGILGSSHHDAMLLGDTNRNYKEQVLANLKSQRLKADPGMFSVYCNDGFTLAEILVEHVSGMSFTDFVRTRITEPLGMKNTYTSMEDFDKGILATTYYAGMETPYEAVAPIASGGIYSTAEDLCKFSRIFMDGQETLLEKPYRDEMAKAWYLEDEIGVQHGDSMFCYGLGWDAVENYPFNQYGIKALAKGGDTTVYHANLTVLPEHQMSMAVVASGGSSVECQVAAQEILLELLKEEGIIDEIKEEKAFVKEEKVAIPESMKQYTGFYQAKNMIKVTFTEEDTMMVQELDGKYPSTQEYIYTSNGKFVSSKGQYISSTGALVAAENGRKGVSYLRFSKEANGETYILSSSYESTSGLGKTAFTLPIAQKVEPVELPEKVTKAWEQREDKKYYVVAERYSSSYNLTLPYLEIGLLKEVPGYTKNTEGVMNARIIDENTALNGVQIPGVLGRDTKDLVFFKEKGVEYLKCADFLFMSEDSMSTTADLKGNCQIDENGYTKWYAVENGEVGKEIMIEVPSEAAYYVYNEEDKCIASSILKGNSSSVMLPKNGRISLVGNPGAIFRVSKVGK